MTIPALNPRASLMVVESQPVTPLPWVEAQTRIAENRIYWLTTVRSTGQPHTRPVLAGWVGAVLYTTSSQSARKARNLQAGTKLGGPRLPRSPFR